MKSAWAAMMMLVLGSAAQAGSYETYKELMPHSATELATMKTAAETGDAKAQLAYGKALEYQRLHGKGVGEADVRLWLRKAADQGSGEAWYWISTTTTDAVLRLQAMQKSADLGFEPAFDDVLEMLLLRAGEKADPAKAKRYADLARLKGFKVHDADETLAVVDACATAGSPDVPTAERDAIETDENVQQSYTPNDTMKFAEAYANGWGITRDRKKALALVCRASDVPAELISMVQHLTGAKTMGTPREPFRFCDHVTSGEHGGFCADAEESMKNEIRSDTFDAIIASWTPAQKAAFGTLGKAINAYIEEHAGSEVDMSGTGRATFYIEAIGRLSDQFSADIAAFEKAKLPKHDDFAAADKALNALYRDVLKNTDWSAMGTVTPEGLRKTQRLWLTVRDAWGAFGPVRYKGLTADDWKAWATRQRIALLQDVFNENTRK